MADPTIFKVFLSSPGDVKQERSDAQLVIDEINRNGEFDQHFMLKLYRWDDPNKALPMPVTENPQQSVNRYMLLPSECDLVVVLLWSRMGSPVEENGRQYLSGTHYEYSEALENRQEGKPEVWLYRCTSAISLNPDDPDFDEKKRQYDRVKQFFAQFRTPTGSFTGGVTEFKEHQDFKEVFKRQLVTHLRKLRESPTIPVTPARTTTKTTDEPYRGLKSLEEQDAQIFFGRELEKLEVLSRIESKRLVFVMGASGSGKSSLAAAGVLPALRERGWKIVRCVPGDDPFFQIARAMVMQLPELGVNPLEYVSAARRLADILRANRANLIDQLSMILPNQRVLLFIDQFEEVFTLADKNQNLSAGSVMFFLDAIRQPATQVTTLITMRADFYSAALAHFEELRQDAYGLTRPSTAALYEMITRPAQLAGLKLEDGLALQIVNDVGSESGALALISYVMETLYLRAKVRGDGRLTRQDYEVDLQGVKGAINTLANRAYNELPFDDSDRQKALQNVFRELVLLTEEDRQFIATRKRARLSDFRLDSNELRLIQKFAQARLLVIDKDGLVEVAHESLFHNWDRIREWLATTQEDLVLLRQLRVAASEWERRGKPPYLLWLYERQKPALEMLERLQLPPESPLDDFMEPEHTRLLQDFIADETNYVRLGIIDRWSKIGADAVPSMVKAVLYAEEKTVAADDIGEVDEAGSEPDEDIDADDEDHSMDRIQFYVGGIGTQRVERIDQVTPLARALSPYYKLAVTEIVNLIHNNNIIFASMVMKYHPILAKFVNRRSKRVEVIVQVFKQALLESDSGKTDHFVELLDAPCLSQSPALHDFIVNNLDHSEEQIQYAIVKLLGKRDWMLGAFLGSSLPDIYPILLKHVGSPDLRIRMFAMQILLRLTNDSSILSEASIDIQNYFQVVAGWLESEQDAVLTDAIAICMKLTEHGVFDESLIPRLVHLSMQGDDKNARLALDALAVFVRAGVRHDNMFHAAIHALSSKNAPTRASAVTMLGELRDPLAVPSLETLLNDTTLVAPYSADSVAIRAAIALAKLGAVKGFELLAIMLRSPVGGWGYYPSQIAQQALENMNVPEAREILEAWRRESTRGTDSTLDEDKPAAE